MEDDLIFLKFEDKLIILKSEDDLNFYETKMEYKLNYFKSRRQPQYTFESNQLFQMKDDLKKIMEQKTVKIKTKIKAMVVALLFYICFVKIK